MFSLRSCTAFLIALLISLPALGQRHPTFPIPPESAQKKPFPNAVSSQNSSIEVQARAADAHKKILQSDLDKLARLVSDLKSDLERTPAGVLSTGALKKSEEIEKLSKRLRKELHGE